MVAWAVLLARPFGLKSHCLSMEDSPRAIAVGWVLMLVAMMAPLTMGAARRRCDPSWIRFWESSIGSWLRIKADGRRRHKNCAEGRKPRCMARKSKDSSDEVR
jgi:hypothetical protein